MFPGSFQASIFLKVPTAIIVATLPVIYYISQVRYL